MIEFKKLVSEPPVIEFTYPIDHIKPSFDKVNELGNFQYGSRNFVPSWVDHGQQREIDKFYKDFLNCKNDIILKLLETDTQTRYHRRDFDKIINNLRLSIFPIIDKKGYNLGWHLDHRLIFANGIFNVMDNDSHTEFSIANNGDTLYHTMSGEKNVGTFWLSTENNWHRVKEITKDRYIIAFSFSFFEL